MHSYLWSIYIVCMACQKTLFAFVSPIDIYHSGHSSYVFWDIYHRIVYSVGKAKYCFKISWTVSQLLIWIPHGGSSSAYLNTFPGSCTFSLLIFFFFLQPIDHFQIVPLQISQQLKQRKAQQLTAPAGQTKNIS